MDRVTLIGIGGGSLETMTVGGFQEIRNADILIGASRVLESISFSDAHKFMAIIPSEIEAIIEENPNSRICVLYSGDTGFYSGNTGLAEHLREKEIEFRIIPGLSSVQLLSSRLGIPWQDWNLVSAHGRDANVLGSVMKGRDTFFLTGGDILPCTIARTLCEAGLGDTKMEVAERLSYDDERIVSGTAEEVSEMAFDALSVVLVHRVEKAAKRIGISDDEFIRGDIPMTKRDVRAAVMARLDVRENETVWDIGAGTGSVSIELALAASEGSVYAVECEHEGCELIRQNRKKFGTYNLSVINGRAPAVLDGLPQPDAVFIGGTKGGMKDILDCVYSLNPDARVCVTAIAIETLGKAIAEFNERGINVEISQIQSAHSRKAGSLNLMMADNPIFIITGGCNA